MSDQVWVDEVVHCRDTECPGLAEPDGDSETQMYVCAVCGFEFGYRMVRKPADSGTCAIGVSPEVRMRLGADPRPQPVMVSIGRRPE